MFSHSLISSEYEAMHLCSYLEIFVNYGFACTGNIHFMYVSVYFKTTSRKAVKHACIILRS